MQVRQNSIRATVDDLLQDPNNRAVHVEWHDQGTTHRVLCENIIYLWVWTTRPSVRRRDGQLVCQWTALVSVAMRAFLASHRHCGRSSEGQMVHSPLRPHASEHERNPASRVGNVLLHLGRPCPVFYYRRQCGANTERCATEQFDRRSCAFPRLGSALVLIQRRSLSPSSPQVVRHFRSCRSAPALRFPPDCHRCWRSTTLRVYHLS
ncbi:uncharacterized protein B0H18DRAFT_620105 [Fomitopsis serialis]|uniref:uncharacterized protein n=1 Tax=Fomitopsis serialis TaxID=139415 RepID=UPI002007F0F0|nr:uncharacterized protein B0H18DRAFT_620105 [Neoantrodia serialis]KAH9919922.1 hypothetical protein B0H18DRAFT_620105 [Neoantrodia serialis]